MNIEKKINRLMSIFISIGIPLCLVGTGIIIFCEIFGKEQTIGNVIAFLGFSITILILPLIVIKLFLINKRKWKIKKQ